MTNEKRKIELLEAAVRRQSLVIQMLLAFIAGLVGHELWFYLAR